MAYSPYGSGTRGHYKNTEVEVVREILENLLSFGCRAVAVDTLKVLRGKT